MTKTSALQFGHQCAQKNNSTGFPRRLAIDVGFGPNQTDASRAGAGLPTRASPSPRAESAWSSCPAAAPSANSKARIAALTQVILTSTSSDHTIQLRRLDPRALFSSLPCILKGALDRDANQLAPRSHPHFVEQVLQCGLDRTLRNPEVVRHLLVRKTFKDTSENLLFTRSKACG